MNRHKLDLGIALVLLLLSVILMCTYDGFLFDFTYSPTSLGLNMSFSVIILVISLVFFYRAHKNKQQDKED